MEGILYPVPTVTSKFVKVNNTSNLVHVLDSASNIHIFNCPICTVLSFPFQVFVFSIWFHLSFIPK